MGLFNFSLLTCFTFLTLATLMPTTKAGKVPNATYWEQRDTLLAQDLEEMLGNDLIFSHDEDQVNYFLMDLKEKEMNLGFETLDFFPARNFLEAKNDIDSSEVLKFIRQVPKGALLHSHDMAITSIEWVVSEITYWDDLYMCNTTDGFLIFKFFWVPDNSCDWTLVSQERASYPSAEEFDTYLSSKLSLCTTDVKDTYPDINSIWAAFEHVFTSISGMITYDKAWASYLGRAMYEVMEDNVSYLEFRGILPLLYDKAGRIYTAQETVGLYRDVIANFTTMNSNNFFGARFIYAPPRLVDVRTVWGYVELVTELRNLYPTIVAGFDLVGQEDMGQPLSAFVDPLLTLGKQDPPIPVFFHAGETNWEGMSSDENLFDAILLNSTRIGHAYAIVKHPLLMQMARENDIAIEVCPISNQILMLVNDLRNHPATALTATSFPVVVSSDDPAIWEALPLSHDFYEAFMGIGGAKADLKFLKKLALNSIRYSSLTPQQKDSLEIMWNAKWDKFIQAILLENHLLVYEESNVIPKIEEQNNAIS